MDVLKPVVVAPQPERTKCPICGQTTFSRGGVHPQCAMQQADAPRIAQLRAKSHAAAKIEKAKGPIRKKKCPTCDALHDVGQKVCKCGFRFTVAVR